MDNVNPNHYNGTECADTIAVVTHELNGYEGFCIGNVVKYLWRWRKKNGVEDLKKAKRYLEILIDWIGE